MKLDPDVEGDSRYVLADQSEAGGNDPADDGGGDADGRYRWCVGRGEEQLGRPEDQHDVMVRCYFPSAPPAMIGFGD